MMRFLLTTAAAILIATSGSHAQTPRPASPADLQVTAEQQAQLQELAREVKAATAAIRADTQATDQEKAERVQAIILGFQKALTQILTPAQLEAVRAAEARQAGRSVQ